MHFVHHPHGSVAVDVQGHTISHAIEGVVLKKITMESPHVGLALLNSY